MSNIQFYLVLCVLAGVNANNPIENNHPNPGVSNKRIIGGELALIQNYPYQVAIGVQIPESFYTSFICGGSIISKQHILTAGHCIINGYKLRVKLGTSSINNSDGTEINVSAIYRHPNFVEVGTIGYNDIAVLKLSRPIKFGRYAKKINLPAPNSLPTKSIGVITGWGLTSSNATTPSVWLMKAELPVFTRQKCIQAVDKVDLTSIVRDTNLCTLNAGRTKGGCSGDSGGPLVQNGKIIGITSFAPTPCDRSGIPTVYTRVSQFVYWINEQLKK